MHNNIAHPEPWWLMRGNPISAVEGVGINDDFYGTV